MYYVAHDSFIHSDMVMWQQVKRLKDFRPKEGEEYMVRKSRSDIEYHIYKGVDGKLQKTPGSIISLNTLLTF